MLDFDKLIQSLVYAEKNTILLKKREDSITSYRQYGEWFISEIFKKSFPFKYWFYPPEIPGIKKFYYPSLHFYKNKNNSLGLFLGWPLAKRMIAQSRADLIYMNNGVDKRLRSMYFTGGSNLSIKLGFGEKNINRIKNEIKTVEGISSRKVIGNIRVPSILDYYIDKGLIFFCDESILGQEISLRDKNALYEILTFMWNLYLEYGIRLKYINEIIPIDIAIENVAKTLDLLKIKRDDILKKCFSFISSEKLIPYSFVHGDLKRKNVLINKTKKIYLIDWESAGEKPIIKDYSYLYYEYFNLRKNIVNYFNFNMSKIKGNIATFQEQMLLLYLRKLKPNQNRNRLLKLMKRILEVL